MDGKLSAFAFVVLAISNVQAVAGDIKIKLSFDKGTYRVGDNVDIYLTYQNMSDHVIRVLPNPRYFASEVVSLARVSDGARAEYVRADGGAAIDFGSVAKYTVLLEPKDSITRHVSAKLNLRLPADYEPHQGGPFLIFEDSAIKLPSFGKYDAVSVHDCSGEDPLNSQLDGEPALWCGRAESQRVRIHFEAKRRASVAP